MIACGQLICADYISITREQAGGRRLMERERVEMSVCVFSVCGRELICKLHPTHRR